MARTKKNADVQVQAQAQERVVLATKKLADGSTIDIYDIEMAKAMGLIPAEPTVVAQTSAGAGAGTGKGKVKDTPFTKADGTVVMTTAAQAKAWEDARARHTENVSTWADKRSSYKPSKELLDAIKANPASITQKIAKAQYGFVGTSNDLWNLKYGTEGVVKKGTYNK